MFNRLFSFLAAVLSVTALLAQPSTAADAPGSRDYLVSRLPSYEICQFEEKNFDRERFLHGHMDDPKEIEIEGHIIKVNYCLAGEPTRSMLQIYRNYENVIKGMGGVITYGNNTNELYAKVVREGKEIWIHLTGNEYEFNFAFAEKAGMAQEATTADTMKAALDKSGRIALYINFDTGKSDIKPESRPIVDQIVKLLKANPGLKLRIEGHTDNVGAASANKTLSQARAASVVKAIVAQGIDGARLTPAGFGSEKPVASNNDDAGRAKNRRVELVKI